jgi:biotin synthase
MTRNVGLFAPIDSREALELLSAEGSGFYALMARAGAVREAVKGRQVNLCGIINAKSGRCPENCAFCAQSAHFKTEITTYPLVGSDAPKKECASFPSSPRARP